MTIDVTKKKSELIRLHYSLGDYIADLLRFFEHSITHQKFEKRKLWSETLNKRPIVSELFGTRIYTYRSFTCSNKKTMKSQTV